MPKNRYVLAFYGTLSAEFSDNILEIKCQDNITKPATLYATLTGIEQGDDWSAIQEGALVCLRYYDSAGVGSADFAFYGRVTHLEKITQKSMKIEAQDMSIDLQRTPLSSSDLGDRFHFSRENNTILQIVSALNSYGLDGATAITTPGTIDNTIDGVDGALVPKFEVFFYDRLSALQSLASQTKHDLWFGADGKMNFTLRSSRGKTVQDSGVSTSTSTNTLTDTSKTWTTNQWVGFVLRDSSAMDFMIVSNTSNALTLSGTPAGGAYAITRGYFGTGANKNAAYAGSTYNGENIWNAVRVSGANGVSAFYTDISTKVAYTAVSDTRLTKVFDSHSDNTIYLESTDGVPDSPGLILITDGTPNFLGGTAFTISKSHGFFYYAGVTGNTLTGVKATGNPCIELSNLGGAKYQPERAAIYFMNKLRADTTTGFANSGNLLIGSEVIQYGSKDSAGFNLGDVGTGILSGTTFTDSTKSWTPGGWVGYSLVTSQTISNTACAKIIGNTATSLTLSTSSFQTSGKYIIIPSFTNSLGYQTPIYGRSPAIQTTSTATLNPSDTVLYVTSTAGFSSAGYLQLYNNTGTVQIVQYTAITDDHTFNLVLGDGNGQGALGTKATQCSNGIVVRQLFSSNIHPKGVRVQQYPSGGTPETGSSVQKHGKRSYTVLLTHAVNIETAELLASRILMNHRFGDLYNSFVTYTPKDFNNFVMGDYLEITDRTLNLNAYSDYLSQKEFYTNTSTGEFYIKFWIGNPPRSDLQKMIDLVLKQNGGSAQSNDTYVTRDTPASMFRELCGAPSAKFMGIGADFTNSGGNGYVLTNNLWIEPYSENGPTVQTTPFWCYSVVIDENNVFAPYNSSTAPTGRTGGIYYDTSSNAMKYYNGTSWVDFGGAGSSLWTQGSGFIYPTINQDVCPNTDSNANLGSSAKTWYNVFADNISTSYINMRATGGTVFEAFSPTSSTSNITASTSITPKYNATYNLGDLTYRWTAVYAYSGYFGSSYAYGMLYAASSYNVELLAQGSSTNISVSITAKGSGTIYLNGFVYTTSRIQTTSGIYIGGGTTGDLFDDSSNGSSSYTHYIGNRSIDTSASDERMKKNIEESKEDVFKVLNKMRVVDFEWKDEETPTGKHVGLIAQEVDSYLPQVVRKPSKPEEIGWAVEYHHIVPYLIMAVKELKKENDDLKKKINEIECKL
ncbi:MAG: tail fiber domain-containing protein [Patescibacteria group bacterium]